MIFLTTQSIGSSEMDLDKVNFEEGTAIIETLIKFLEKVEAEEATIIEKFQRNDPDFKNTVELKNSVAVDTIGETLTGPRSSMVGQKYDQIVFRVNAVFSTREGVFLTDGIFAVSQRAIAVNVLRSTFQRLPKDVRDSLQNRVQMAIGFDPTI